MAAWQKVAAYAAGLVAVLVAAVGIGRLVGPVDTDETAAHDAGGHGEGERVHLDPAGESGHGEHEQSEAPAYELAVEDDVVGAGRATVAFRVLDEAGEPVTSYDVQHEKRLHLIAVRRDLAEFRHVHPRLDPATGRWSVPVDLDAGSWRLYADFAPAGADPALAEAELMVAGAFRPETLGPDKDTSRVDDYEVHLTREGSAITLHVTRDGREVTDLQPYLGAYGHLVAIRAEDLGYLHVHPEEGPAGPEVAFHAEFAEPGRYRLFLDFMHEGVVRTADFTITVGERAEQPSEQPGNEPTDEHEEDGHEH